MKTRAGKVIMVCAQKPVVTFWKRNGASRESFYCNVIFGRVVQGRGSLVTKLHVGEGSARVSHRSERCVCPPLNSLSGSGCTLLLVRMFVWRLRVWAWKAATPSDDSALHHWQRQTHRGKGTDASLLWRCASLCLCVWSLSEVGYIMVKCESSPRALPPAPFAHWGTFQLSHLPCSSHLPIFFTICSPSPGLIPWLHSMLFFSAYSERSAVLALRVASW